MSGKSLSLDDMFDVVVPLSFEKKMAIAFAVYSGKTLSEVKSLKWSDEIELENWRSVFILTKLKVSDQIDNVFWECKNGKHMEIDSLQFWFDVATLWVNWEWYSKRYKNTIPIEFQQRQP